MVSDVWFINYRAASVEEAAINKIARLIDEAHLMDVISPHDLTAVKVHFGEIGNNSFIPPWYIRIIVDKIKSKGGKPFLVDTNTLYLGSRKNSVDHLTTAIMHGFEYAVTGAPLIIADGLRGNNYVDEDINQKHFQKVKIARDIYEADSMVVVSHFKGHIMAGFGGAIKNLAMGCSPAAGKIEQHSARPKADTNKCIGCGTCVNYCPRTAIELVDQKAVVHVELCIGCGECMANCPEKAMTLDWTAEIPPFTERLTEYALGAVKNKAKKVAYISFIIDVTPDCDCMSWTDAKIVPDVGILASFDPVALDKACFDLVNQQVGCQHSALKTNFGPQENKFRGVNQYTKGEIQWIHGEKIGLGSSQYRLIEITYKQSEKSKH